MKIFGTALFLSLFALTIVAGNKMAAQSVLLSPSGNQTVTQPSGTTLSVTSLNGQLTVSAVSGADISGAVSTALSTVGSTCGTVTIAPGSYKWGTPSVKMLPCETLQGVGVTVAVTVTGTSPFLIVEGPAPPNTPTNTTYTMGSIRGITFVGPSTPSSQSSSTGIELGGTTSTEPAQLFNLYDIHIRSFGCGINVEWAHQIAFFGGIIEANYDGICFANIVSGLENFNFHGTQILNNLDYGINHNQTGVFVEMFLTDCSLDYNGQGNKTSGGQIQFTNGKLDIIGGHLENNVLPMITVMQPQAPALVNLYISGAAFNLTDATASDEYTSFINNYGDNPVLEIGRGVSFSSQGAGVVALATWDPVVNQNSRLLMDPYTYIVVTIPAGLQAFVGNTPNDYSYPTYDIHDNITGTTASFSY